MKKYLLHILLFFVLIAIIDLVIGYVGSYLQEHSKGGTVRQFNDLVSKDKHDVLILGSSRAHHHYDTPFMSDTLGMDVYNAGYDGNGVVLAEGILEMVLARYAPKVILFDVEPSFDIVVYDYDNSHVRYISNLKPYYNKKGVSEIIKEVSMDEWYKVQSGMIRYNTRIINSFVDNIIDRGMEKGGFAPLEGCIVTEPRATESSFMEIDSLKLAYIVKLIALCQSHNVPLVLVGSPRYGQLDSSALDPVKEIADHHSVHFWNYYVDPSFNSHKEWFKEPMHLNREGARVFSRIITKRLIEEKLIN